MLVDAWLPRAARAHPERRALNGLDYAELFVAAREAAAALAARGRRAGPARRARAPARNGLRDRPPRGLAARRGRGPARPAAHRGRAPARRPRARPRRSRSRERHLARGHPRPRRAGARPADERDERHAEAGGAHLRQPAVERARLGRGARGRARRRLALHAAALPRRRALDPRPLGRSTRPTRSSTSASTPAARSPRCRPRASRSSRWCRRRCGGSSTRGSANPRRCGARCSAARPSRPSCSSGRRRSASASPRPTG